ncbi:F-box/kelch-repeat protein At3g23880-like [Salvia splendens]|uniref:F-box/kelch-repeat protein At3g23880-like n=1 Tax=Salvia splendens TaxID=180675 RepID=UPI001C27F613|nr:F-box/kelch-repeat protein At3g23880-like [Salvia splendens]
MEDPSIVIPKLPNDVIIEILTRLPVKPLLKFKCVCKSWRALISSTQFVAAHLEFSKSAPNLTTHRLILKYRGNTTKQCSVNSILHQSVPEAFDLSCSLISERYRWVVGSCNGLVCLLIDKKEMILWNPSTGICKKLPDCGVEINVGDYYSYYTSGLGYDKSSDDYKVVGFFNNNRDLSEVMVQVYSLKNDKWKRIENFKGRWSMDGTATFANGKLYWIANQGNELESGWDILSVDLETEEYEMLQVPSYVKSGYYSRLGGAWEGVTDVLRNGSVIFLLDGTTSNSHDKLAETDRNLADLVDVFPKATRNVKIIACVGGLVSEGSLHVLCSHLESTEVWTMDVGGGDWTKVATVPYIDDFLKYSYKKASYVLKDGQVLLLCGSTFVIYDAEDCSFRYPEVRDSGELVGVGAYLGSLVSPVG